MKGKWTEVVGRILKTVYDSEPHMKGTWMRPSLGMAPIIAVGLLGILIAAPSAAGQAAIKQYTPNGNPAGGNRDAGGSLATPIPASSGTGARKVSADQGSGTDKGGRLPGTDYPSTPWLWIVIALLLAAALVRVGAEALGRREAPNAS
jgi:hypothetical protein